MRRCTNSGRPGCAVGEVIPLVVMVATALQGELFKLPVIGDFAGKA
jgi:uncharacterized membrane protein